jgi:hypothetical protein
MALGEAWAYYIPETLLCPVIIFAAFVAARNAQIVIAVTYVPPYFKFSVCSSFPNFRINLYHQVLVLFPVFEHAFWLYFTFIQIQFGILQNWLVLCSQN